MGQAQERCCCSVSGEYTVNTIETASKRFDGFEPAAAKNSLGSLSVTATDTDTPYTSAFSDLPSQNSCRNLPETGDPNEGSKSSSTLQFRIRESIHEVEITPCSSEASFEISESSRTFVSQPEFGSSFFDQDFNEVHSGTLWKLNHDRGKDLPKNSTSLMHWRRRDFALRIKQDMVGLMYISDKKKSNIAISFAGSKAHASGIKVEEERKVHVDGMDKEDTEAVCGRLHKYESACHDGKARSDSNAYVDAIPVELHPIVIEWIDHECKSCILVVATETARDQGIWTRSIKINLGLKLR